MYQTITTRPFFGQTQQIYRAPPRRFLEDVATPHIYGGTSEIPREVIGRYLASA